MNLSIDNFSMDLDDVALCTSLVDFSVEVTDSDYLVTTSGTYFTDNGVQVPGTLASVSGGYILTYSVLPSGTIDLVAHGSNSNGEFLTRSYELQYGYAAYWNEVKYWGTLKEVPISVSASNTSLTNNTSYFSTFFTTRKMMSTDLGVDITAEGSGFDDIMTYITPQSKHFMYGKTYSITVSGIQDFSGNILPPETYNFTIEEIN